MQTFIINLKRRPDRRQRISSILPPQLDVEYTTDWDGPLDGLFINRGDLTGYGLFPWKIDSDNEWWCRPLKKGEIGCSISHWLCWNRAYISSGNVFLFLEDDAVLVEGFYNKLLSSIKTLTQYDKSWDLLYLGRFPLYPDQPAIDGIVRPGYSHCSFGYILTRAALEKVLQTNFHHAIIPVDEFLPALYVDHPRHDVRLRYQKCLAAYALQPPIVLQLPKTEAGSDTEASDFME